MNIEESGMTQKMQEEAKARARESSQRTWKKILPVEERRAEALKTVGCLTLTFLAAINIATFLRVAA